jgi:hypothetical protein
VSSGALPQSALTSTISAASVFGLNRRRDRAAVRRAISGIAASVGETATAALIGFVSHLTFATRNPLNMLPQKNPS